MRRNQRSIAIYAMVIGFCLGMLSVRLFGAELQRPPMRRDDPPVLQRPPMRRDPVLVAASPQSVPITSGTRFALPIPQPAPVTSGPCRDCLTAPHLVAPSRAMQGIAQPLPGPVLVANSDTVLVTVSPMAPSVTERILGKRLSKVVMVWLVHLENQGFEPVLIAPSAVHRRVAHLQPFDYASISLLIDEGARNSFLSRSGRVAGDIGKLSAFMIAANTIRIAEAWPLALLTGAEVIIPYIVSRLKGVDVPIAANFARLAWTLPVSLGPGETVSVHMYTALWGDPSPVSFSIDSSRTPMRRSLQ